MKAWVVLIVGGFGTYLTRASFFLLPPEFELPSWFRRSLRYVAPAVFAAIVLPAVVGDSGLGDAVTPDARVLAAALAALVAYRTRNISWVLVVGMLALWGLQAVGL